MDVGVNVPVTVMLPNTGDVEPLIVVVPLKVIVLDVSVDVELLTKFPFKSIAFDPALKLPFDTVSMPLTVMAEFRVRISEPCFVKFLS